MKTLLVLAASTLALGACTPRSHPPQRVALDCPASQGKLTRTGKAADGRSCTYSTSKGAEVDLQLVAVQGDVNATLLGVETGLLPQKTEAEITEAIARADSDASSGDDGDHDGDRVDIDMPGMRIVADNDKAAIKIGGMTVNAGGDGAIIRSQDDVRLKGDQLSRDRRGIRARYLHAGKDLPGGWRYVGYEAAGPKAGPLAVAVIRSKVESDSIVAGVDEDLKRLVRRNGGV